MVASEIGTLAIQSADAASTTRDLIAVSISEVEKGVALANEVTEILQTVVSGIESISIAVQNTSVAAEESSATSEELAAQSTVLSELIAKFDLSDV